MNTKGNNLDDISERLVDAILSDNILSKEELIPKCRSILKAWVNAYDRPVNYDNIKTDKGVLQRTIEQRGFEKEFWKNKLSSLIGKEKMKEEYAEINKELEIKGY